MAQDSPIGSMTARPAGDRGRPDAAMAIWQWKARRPAASSGEVASALRRRGLIRAAIGAAIGVLVYLFLHHVAAYVVWSISGLTLLLAMVSPTRAYLGLERGLERFGYLVGRAMAWILLPLVFLLFMFPFGLFFRRGRKDKLTRWFEPDAPTYWNKRDHQDFDRESYERQF